MKNEVNLPWNLFAKRKQFPCDEWINSSLFPFSIELKGSNSSLFVIYINNVNSVIPINSTFIFKTSDVNPFAKCPPYWNPTDRFYCFGNVTAIRQLNTNEHWTCVQVWLASCHQCCNSFNCSFRFFRFQYNSVVDVILVPFVTTRSLQ